MAWKYRFVIAACARWEAPYAAEWLAYHRAIGFEHVYLYCNDDDPAELYEAILPFTQGPDPFVTFRFFPEQGMQRKMLLHFCTHNGQDAEWISFLDLDEFLRLPSGQSLPDYMRNFENKTDCLMFNWVYCGPNGHKTPPKSVLKGLTRRQPSIHPFTKMVFRSWILGQPELFKNVTDNSFVHRLHQYVSADIRPMNVLGEDMSGYYDDTHFNKLADEWAHDRKPLNRIFESDAFIHHYAFRTEAAFTDRVARGLGGDFHGQGHWGRVAADEELRIGFTANINAVEDMTLAKVWDEIIAASARLSITPVPDPPVPVFLAEHAALPPQSGFAAVVLVVKDEVSDIISWLAWYRLLGFDAAIVYDDGSTDGTWDKLEQAAKLWDVRLCRTIGSQDVHYEIRQSKSYQHALAAYAGVFEWLGFFDADEFLQLSRHKTIREFLATFPEADEVGVNWCNYGSSGHILKPDIPAPLAYHWHSSVHTPVNRHVKSFVRPEKVGRGWVNVHCFDVAPDRAVLASGQRLEWSEKQGIIAGTPDWSVAKVMHYQCRSMEHFIERMKRRPELPATQALWHNYDYHDAEDASPLSMAKALQAGIWSLTSPPQLNPEALPDAPAFLIGESDPARIEEMLTAGLRVVAVQPEAPAYYALTEQFAASIAEGRLVLENFAPAPRGGEIALLTPSNGGRPYHVATISWEELVAKHGRPSRVHMGAEIPGFPAMPG
ncbi:MAG: glycosyltransferase family 2 protein [Rhodospirillales bacterium]|nr:glycosyltransferase family 2 protein [Rhodospirillales bacterium]